MSPRRIKSGDFKVALGRLGMVGASASCFRTIMSVKEKGAGQEKAETSREAFLLPLLSKTAIHLLVDGLRAESRGL